jgi:hypothetical protein
VREAVEEFLSEEMLVGTVETLMFTDATMDGFIHLLDLFINLHSANWK